MGHREKGVNKLARNHSAFRHDQKKVVMGETKSTYESSPLLMLLKPGQTLEKSVVNLDRTRKGEG